MPFVGPPFGGQEFYVLIFQTLMTETLSFSFGDVGGDTTAHFLFNGLSFFDNHHSFGFSFNELLTGSQEDLEEVLCRFIKAKNQTILYEGDNVMDNYYGTFIESPYIIEFEVFSNFIVFYFQLDDTS